MPSYKLMTKDVRNYLENGDILSALIRTSADLEALFHDKLVFEAKIPFDLIDKWTLGKHIVWVLKYKLIDFSWKEDLELFNTLRNKLVHTRSLFKNVLKDKTKKEILVKRILRMCELIDEYSVSYPLLPQDVEELFKYLRKKKDREDKLFKS